MEPAQTVNEVYYLKQIIELKDEIIKLQKELLEKDKIIEKDKEIIRDLQNKLNIENNGKNIISINSSTPNISTPNPITPSGSLNISEKEIIFKMEDLKAAYYTIYILQDERLASGGNSTSIIIYNNQTFKSEMTIKEYSNYIMHLTQLKNGNLVSL